MQAATNLIDGDPSVDASIAPWAPQMTSAFSSAVASPPASANSSSIAAAPLSAATAEAEIAFLSGVTSGNVVAATSFNAWNQDAPATYSSMTDTAKWGSSVIGSSGGTVTYYFDPASSWTPTEKAVFVAAMSLWSSEVNIKFAETAVAANSGFTITRGSDGGAYWSDTTSGSAAGSSSLGTPFTGGLLSIDTSVPGFGPVDGSFSNFGGYAYQTIIHELGHALGLGHGGAYNGSVSSSTQQFSAYDTTLYTLMSYIDPTDTGAKFRASYPVTGTSWGVSLGSNGLSYGNVPTTPMMLDIAAAQRLYGAATSGPLSGGQVYGFNSNIAAPVKQFFDFTVNTPSIVTLWNAGTGNTLDLSGWSANETVNLNPGTFSSVNGHVNNVGIAIGTQINGFVGGSGSDTITANNFSDTINGGGGTDTADYSSIVTAGLTAVDVNGAGTVTKGGGLGNDTLSSIEKIIGGAGNDTFNVNTAVAVVGGAGFNTVVEASDGVTVALGSASFLNIQQFIAKGGTNIVGVQAGDSDTTYLYGGGAGSSNTLTTGTGGGYMFSTGGTNHMFGGAGVNVFIGGIGTSDMHGGSGNNVYYTGSADTLVGAGTYNTDVLLAQNVTLALGTSHIQQVILNGGTNSVDMTGSTDFVYLYGGGGTNTLRLGVGGGYELSTGGINHMFGGSSGSGTDVFVGGVGVSDMHGGTGSNVYYVGASDTVAGAGTYNTLVELAQGVTLTLGAASLTGVQQFILNSGANSVDASSAITQVYIYGGANNDRIGGGTGSDYLWGEGGTNTFVLKDHWGHDQIQDWTSGIANKIDMTALATIGVHALTDITIASAGGNTTVTHGADALTLLGYSGGLAASNFIFA